MPSWAAVGPAGLNCRCRWWHILAPPSAPLTGARTQLDRGRQGASSGNADESNQRRRVRPCQNTSCEHGPLLLQVIWSQLGRNVCILLRSLVFCTPSSSASLLLREREQTDVCWSYKITFSHNDALLAQRKGLKLIISRLTSCFYVDLLLYMIKENILGENSLIKPFSVGEEAGNNEIGRMLFARWAWGYRVMQCVFYGVMDK